MIKIDGSRGEGGGAILRQALALSTLTGKPFEMNNIRKGRPQPGLKAQHMHALIALEKLSNSTVTNYELGSEKITFMPGTIKKKNVEIDVGTAGSITLLSQAFLLPCVLSGQNITITLTGGTDVKWAQPIDYMTNVLAPIMKRFCDIEINTLKRGYYPKGKGKVAIKIKGKNFQELKNLNLTERGKILSIRGVSHASTDLMDANVADRQAESARALLTNYGVPININRSYSKTESIGSGITLWAIFGQDTTEFSWPIILGADSLGEKNKKAETVGEEAATNLRKEIKSQAIIDKYLADQLIPILGVFKGCIQTSEVTEHTKSNIYVTEQFLNVKFRFEGNKIIAE